MFLRSLCLISATLASMATADPQFWRHEWPTTDFSQTNVESWTEIISGGPPKDGIPALFDPDFLAVAQETTIDPREPVITVAIEGHPARAYPIRYLTWHEIVNDRIGEIPVTVTFCPLCNSAITFDGRAAGRELRFGVTGKLRNSDMVMYDKETESWWQQATGEAIVGQLTGTKLQTLPSWMESFGQFSGAHPDGLIMAQPAFRRNYGRNPYARYDSSSRPFLYSGENPPHDIAPLIRVVRVGNRAWPLTRLAETPTITEAGITLTWRPGQASALDHAVIAYGRDVGSVRVRDAAGNDLPHDVMFAFAFHAFWPEGIWMLGQKKGALRPLCLSIFGKMKGLLLGPNTPAGGGLTLAVSPRHGAFSRR